MPLHDWISSLSSRARHWYRWVIMLLTFCMLGACMLGPDVFIYTKVYTEKSDSTMLLSMLAVGSIVGMYPTSVAVSRYGARWIATASGIVVTVSTVLFPLCLDTSFVLAIIMRIIQGIGFAIDFTLIGWVAQNWSSTAQNTIFLAILSSFVLVKSVVQMPLTTKVLDAYGWRAVYYFLGAITMGVTAVWALVYRDDPRKSCASKEECDYIEHGKYTVLRPRVPYMKFITNIPVLALWLAALVDTAASVMLIIYMSTYFDRLGFTQQENGFATALPGISYAVAKLGTGLVCDVIGSRISESVKIRFCTTTSLLCAATVLAVAAFTKSEENHTLAETLLLSSFWEMFKALTVPIEPPLFSWMVPSNTLSQWKWFFLAHAFLLVVGWLAYFIFLKTTPPDFVRETAAIQEKEERQRLETITDCMSSSEKLDSSLSLTPI